MCLGDLNIHLKDKGYIKLFIIIIIYLSDTFDTPFLIHTKIHIFNSNVLLRKISDPEKFVKQCRRKFRIYHDTFHK